VGLRLIRNGVTHFGTSVNLDPAALRELAQSLAEARNPESRSYRGMGEGERGG